MKRRSSKGKDGCNRFVRCTSGTSGWHFLKGPHFMRTSPTESRRVLKYMRLSSPSRTTSVPKGEDRLVPSDDPCKYSICKVFHRKDLDQVLRVGFHLINGSGESRKTRLRRGWVVCGRSAPMVPDTMDFAPLPSRPVDLWVGFMGRQPSGWGPT